MSVGEVVLVYIWEVVSVGEVVLVSIGEVLLVRWCWCLLGR